MSDEQRQEPKTRSMFEESRRDFLMLVSLGVGALAATVAAVPMLTFLLAPVFEKMPPVWIPVGPVNQFKVGDTVEVALMDSSGKPWGAELDKTAAWLRRESDSGFVAFSVDCTHLGCPVRWEPEAELFMCPCHGGVYFSNGDVAAGPPPDPLQQFPVRIQGTNVEVQWKPLPWAPHIAGCKTCGKKSNEVEA